MNISPQALIAVVRLNITRRPLMSAEAAQDLLDINRRQLDALVENGAVAWAWNFAVNPGRKAAKKEIRLLAASVVERAAGPILSIGATRNLGFPEVLSLVLPAQRETLRGAELQRWFSVSADWCRDMRRIGAIKCVAEKLPAKGVNASPHFTRESVVEFIKSRRMT